MSGKREIPAGVPWSARRERLRRRLLVLFLVAEAAGILALAVAGALPDPSTAARHRAERALVLELGLSGVALFPEATYCRQPALSDPFTPHSLQPAAPDLLPAGSLVPPHPWAEAATRAVRSGDGVEP